MKNLLLLIVQLLLLPVIFGVNSVKNTSKKNSNSKLPIINLNKEITTHANFELVIENETVSKSTKVFYIENKTTGFDSGYDSSIFGGVSQNFGVYTKLVAGNDTRKLSIQTLPNENYETMIIPIGIIASTNEEVKISSISENFPENLIIYLEDKTNNTFINLSQEEYTFIHSDVNTETGRFYIHTTYKVPYSYTWNGATNTNWDLATNWDENSTPPHNANITIPSSVSNYPTLSSSVTISNITINSGATLLTNGFNITGVINYKRELTTNWHLVASPVANETITNLISNNNFATGTGANIGIGSFTNNGTSAWEYKTINSTGILNNGMGISVKLSSASELSFTGSINSSDVSYTISNGSRNNFNLVGNPFTAYVNAATFLDTNTSLLSEETIWVWNGTNYITYNSVNPIEIAPTQGFFIETANSGNITFSTSNQSHQSSDTFLRKEPISNFELFIKNNTHESGTKIFYVDGKTTGFDTGYDSKMFGDTNYNFAVFTQLVTENLGDNLAIQTLPNENHHTMIIPVGIIAKQGEEITFSIGSINLPDGLEVYLEDKDNGEFTNLSEVDYKTTLDKDVNGIGNYYIHTQAKSLSTIDNNISNVSIYKSSNTEVTIAGFTTEGKVTVSSLFGTQVLKTSINSNGVSKINLPTLSAGVYIISLKSNIVELTKKIIIE